jgi:hypothetical protein
VTSAEPSGPVGQSAIRNLRFQGPSGLPWTTPTEGSGGNEPSPAPTSDTPPSQQRAYSPERFDALVEEFEDRSVGVMLSKREEYSPHSDRLQNFREIAQFQGIRPSQVAMTYLLKHIQSINEAVRSGNIPNWVWTKPDGSEGFKQRFADVLNYVLLLAACVDEEVEPS